MDVWDLNKKLQSYLPHRTLEAIKSERRRPTHKKMVRDLIDGCFGTNRAIVEEDEVSEKYGTPTSDRGVFTLHPPVDESQCEGTEETLLNELYEHVSSQAHLYTLEDNRRQRMLELFYLETVLRRRSIIMNWKIL